MQLTQYEKKKQQNPTKSHTRKLSPSKKKKNQQSTMKILQHSQRQTTQRKLATRPHSEQARPLS